MRKNLFIFFLLFSSLALQAQTEAAFKADSTKTDTVKTDKKQGIIKRLLDYFGQSNKGKDHGKFDFSVIGGPHYDTDTKLGIGLIAAGLYYSNARDSLLPPSNVSLYGDISTTGFYMIGVGGLHIFPHRRYRMEYDASFYSFPSKFWGIGYDNGNNGRNESTMNRFQVDATGKFLFHLSNSLYAGPALAFRFVNARKIERPELLNNEAVRATNVGTGLVFVLDTRDIMTSPKHGCYIYLSQMMRVRTSDGGRKFWTTDFKASTYQPLWIDCTLALQALGTLQSGHIGWTDMAMLGSSHSMRGYYNGRYRDKNKLEIQAELRQHIWHRNGIVAWIGTGTVFPEFKAMRWRHMLPNFGLGYRWEFKKNMNIRLDYGLGKSGQSGFLFNINEAF